MNKITLGLLAGAVAGAVLAYLIEDEPNGTSEQQGPQARLRHSLARAQTQFESARGEALQRQRTALAARPGQGGAVTAPGGLTQQVKSRWHAAVNAGRSASAERQAELRRKYLEDTHRV